jgi:xanthine dehydrogenase accessory factor
MSEYSDYYRQLSHALQAGIPIWQASVIYTDGSTPSRIGMKLAVPLEADPFGNLGGGEMEYAVINTIRDTQPTSILKIAYNLDECGAPVLTPLTDTRMICGGVSEVLIEPLFNPYPLYIIGAGHCGRALAEFAQKTGFRVTVIDNRPELLAPSAFPPETTLSGNDYSALETVIAFSPAAFVVIMTYGHVHDSQVLEACLPREYRYLGMIGSKKKVAETMDKLRRKGIPEELLSKVHAPIGIPIGSHTPTEIAISILAEMIAVRNLH